MSYNTVHVLVSHENTLTKVEVVCDSALGAHRRRIQLIEDYTGRYKAGLPGARSAVTTTTTGVYFSAVGGRAWIPKTLVIKDPGLKGSVKELVAFEILEQEVVSDPLFALAEQAE